MLKKLNSADVRAVAVTGCKMLAVIVLLAAAPMAWAELFLYGFDTFASTKRPAYALGFAIIFGATIVGFGIIPFLRNRFIRIPLVIVVLLGYAADQMFFDITDYHLNLADVRTIWWERGASLDQFSMFATHFGRACVWVIGMGIIFGLAPARRWSLKPLWAAVPLLALTAVSIVIPYTKGGTHDFPPPFALPALFGYVATTTDFVNSADVKYDGQISPTAKHVVFIVDESIRGDALGINQSDVENTPILRERKDRLINFGVAVAAGNCSAIARTMLRYGLRPEDVQQGGLTSLARPSIWKYAKGAGYRTILIEARRGEQAFYFSEWPDIDRYILETDAATYERDGRIAEILLELLNDNTPSFIFINKFGAHVPYTSAYPPGFDKFPAAALAASVDSSPAGSSVTNVALRNRQDVMRAEYNNAMIWGVDGFFRKLLARFDGTKALLIYTSDHGQSLMDGGQKISHCTTTTQNTQIGEGLVPLLALTEIPELGRRLRDSANRASGHATHFEIFPTLLLAMGYDEQWVFGTYGHSLADFPVNRHRSFLVMSSSAERGWFDGAKWMPVD